MSETVRYFLASDAKTQIEIGGKTYKFEASHTNPATGGDWGLLGATGKDAENLAKVARSYSVWEISEVEATKIIQKKRLTGSQINTIKHTPEGESRSVEGAVRRSDGKDSSKPSVDNAAPKSFDDLFGGEEIESKEDQQRSEEIEKIDALAQPQPEPTEVQDGVQAQEETGQVSDPEPEPEPTPEPPKRKRRGRPPKKKAETE